MWSMYRDNICLPLVKHRLVSLQSAREDSPHYFVCDEMGSTIFLLDQEQEIRKSYHYDPFGSIIETSGSIENRITYTGQMYDGISGQYYLRARFYNPKIGRFMQEDAYRGDGLNLYAYCQNNPITYYDPNGYMGLCPAGKNNPQEEQTKGPGSKDSTTATQRINSSGIVTGGENAPDAGKMLYGSEGNAGVIPKEIADTLSGRTYDNFDEFRKDFWREVGNSSYADEFMINGDMTNIYRMRNGGAPIVIDSQTINGSVTYQIHHKTPINQGGGVFDLNNLVVVTPRYHAEILIPEYHGYNGFNKYFK